MPVLPRRGTLPPLRELPGLVRLVARVLRSRLGGPPTAGTMCIVVHPDGRLVAFVRVSYRNGWSMPGGYCDPGEAPELGVAREVLEETGLTLANRPTLITTRDLGHRLDHFFIAMCDPARSVDPTTAWEIRECRWFRWEERPTLDDACRHLADTGPGGVEQLIADQLSHAVDRAPR